MTAKTKMTMSKAISDRENYLRTVEFRYPQWMLCRVGLMQATWHRYREALEELVLRHPIIFPGFKKGSVNFDSFGPAYREGEYYTDNWGCVWFNIRSGMEGQVVKRPLEDYSALGTYQPPDSLIYSERGGRGNWEQIQRNVEAARKEGQLTTGGGDRFFERLHFVRGYENLMMDFANDPPELHQLINMVLDNNMKLVNKWLEIGVDVMGSGDDLGTQTATMMSPQHFRKYLKPGYAMMFGACRAAGAHVRLHTDGHVLEIVDDLIECGVTILNPQVRCNTLVGIEKTCKGKVCIDLDLDRQGFPFWTPLEIKAHIYEAVERLGSPKGGLMLYAECEPDVPFENIEAICEAFEEVRTSYTIQP